MYIYIIQMHTNTLPARVIKKFTKYRYSHVGVCLNKNCDEIYSFGRRTVNNFLNGGFIIERRTGKFFKKFNQTVCRIYELEVSEEQYNGIKKKLDDMYEHNRIYKYDYIGFFLRAFNIRIAFKNSYVCSQFVAELLEEFKIYKFNKNTCFVRPVDFENIKKLKEIYTGKYLAYKT